MPRFSSASCLAWRRYLVRSWEKCSHTCGRKMEWGTEAVSTWLLPSHPSRQRLIISNPGATSSLLEARRTVIRVWVGARSVMVWERPRPWKRGRSLWVQTALYLLPFPMLMTQHFVVHPSCGLRPLTCLLRRSTTATLVVCSVMSVVVGGPQAVPNPRHSRLTMKPQRSASRSRGWYSGGPRPVSWLWILNSMAHGMLRSHGAWRMTL